MAKYAICEDVHYDAGSQTCSQFAYVDVLPSSMPVLTREEGAQLGGAIFVLLFTAWAFRWLRKKAP